MANDLDFFDLAMQPGCTINHVRVFARLRGFTRWDRKDPDYGWAWPAIDTLAGACEISRSTTLRCLKWLTEHRYIKPVSRYGTDGHRTSNAYWMLGRDIDAAPAPTRSRRGRLGVTGDTKADPGLSVKSAEPKCQNTPGLSVTQGDTLTTSENDNTLETTSGADAPGKPKRETWLTPYGDAWIARYGGEPPYKVMAKYLAKLHTDLGAPVLLPRWVSYLARTEPAYVSVPKFCATHGSYNGHAPDLTPRNARNRLALSTWTPDDDR